MIKRAINPRFTVLLVLITVAAFMRIPNAAQLTPWANFTPIGAMALFSGAYFTNKWKALLFQLITLFVSDLIINIFVFDGRYGVVYSGWYVIYGIMLLVVFVGKCILQKVSITNILFASVAAATIHWLIADFTVWISGGTDLRTMTPLTKDWSGLLQCYTQGFPFMKHFLVSNLVYSAVLFGGFELAQKRYPVLSLQMASN